jgi:hypothetical protein
MENINPILAPSSEFQLEPWLNSERVDALRQVRNLDVGWKVYSWGGINPITSTFGVSWLPWAPQQIRAYIMFRYTNSNNSTAQCVITKSPYHSSFLNPFYSAIDAQWGYFAGSYPWNIKDPQFNTSVLIFPTFTEDWVLFTISEITGQNFFLQYTLIW